MDRDANTYLAYIKSSRPTGRAIARQLETTACGIKVPSFQPDVLIRWGSRKAMPKCPIELNVASAIKLAADKVQAIKAFQNAGVYTIPVYDTWEDATQNAGGNIILGRNRSGFGGKDIAVYDRFEMFGGLWPKKPEREHEWYTLYYPPTREVRIHVVGEKVVRVQGKYCDFPELAENNPFVRNYAHGYRFRTPDRELHRNRKAQAILAVQALGLDFGAVDMLLFGSDRDSRVLEVNTAPACSPLTARCYAAEIALLVEQRSSGNVILAPGIMQAEVPDMPEESDEGERYL